MRISDWSSDVCSSDLSLGDIVEQHRDIERPARGDLLDDRRRDRMVGPELAALNLRHETDRADRMLVDRIMMVHVELHLRDDSPQVRNETAEQSGFVPTAQTRCGLARPSQYIECQTADARNIAHVHLDRIRVAASPLTRTRAHHTIK